MWLQMRISWVTSVNEVFLEIITWFLLEHSPETTGKSVKARWTVAGDKNLNIVGDGYGRPSPSCGNTTMASSRVGF
jgi:hypothetical protein